MDGNKFLLFEIMICLRFLLFYDVELFIVFEVIILLYEENIVSEDSFRLLFFFLRVSESFVLFVLVMGFLIVVIWVCNI